MRHLCGQVKKHTFRKEENMEFVEVEVVEAFECTTKLLIAVDKIVTLKKTERGCDIFNLDGREFKTRYVLSGTLGILAVLQSKVSCVANKEEPEWCK